VLKIFEGHPHYVYGQCLGKFPSVLRVKLKSDALVALANFDEHCSIRYPTGVSTIIRGEFLSAVCEISMETSQSTALTLAFCKNAFAI
jgi:hypothetical protein